jgi:hypothetical protein
MTQKQYLPCPLCKDGKLTAVATAPYARGFLIAYQYGSKNIAGCRPCVAGGLRAEAGKSLLFGWFSASALVLNLLFIPWNLLRSFFVSDNPAAVTKLLDKAGIPEPGTEYRLNDAFYSAAAAMIWMDGKVDAAEVSVAKELGARILPDFDAVRLDRLLSERLAGVTVETVGTAFRVYLTPEGQGLVLTYLLAIANADGELHAKEYKYLEQLAVAMGFTKKQFREFSESGTAKAA